MTLDVTFVVVGLAVLTWSANRFVDGAAALATNLGLAPLIVGIVVMGFGTSAPELLISSLAAAQGNPGLSIGNALGSNISNIALILGTVALIAPLAIHGRTIRRELPVLLLATALGWLALRDRTLTRLDGAGLCLALVVAMATLVHLAMAERRRRLAAAEEVEVVSIPTPRASLWLVLGLVGLLASTKLLVDGASGLAAAFGISDLVIGLTIVAIGTSLPELAASVASAIKHEHELATGNVIGSNLFNTLAVIGLPGLIRPGAVPDADAVLGRDYPIMTVLTLGLVATALAMRVRPERHRVVGVLLLGAFAGYQLLLLRATRA